jgi:L-fuconate dehydratase
MREGHYTAPTAPGFSSQMKPEPIAEYRYPDGAFWVAGLASQTTEGTA